MKIRPFIFCLLAFLITGTFAQQKEIMPLDGRGGGIISFYSERDGNAEIYVMNADGSRQTRLTNHQGNDYWPSWASSHSANK